LIHPDLVSGGGIRKTTRKKKVATGKSDEFEATMKNVRTILISVFGVLALLMANNQGLVLAQKGVVSSEGELKSFNFRTPAKKAEIQPKTTTRIDLSVLSREVLANGRISLPIDSVSRVISLTPNEVRTSDYQAFVDRGGKFVPIAKTECRTYRGVVEGLDGSEVRIYLDGEYLGGVVTTPTAAYALDTVASEKVTSNGVSGRIGTVVISKSDRVS
jgi:hypothetical protein